MKKVQRLLNERTQTALKVDGGSPERKTFEPLFTQPLWVAEAQLLDAVGPTITSEQQGTQVTIRVGSPNHARQMSVHIRASNAVQNVTLNGHPVRAEWFSRPNEWARFSAYAGTASGYAAGFVPGGDVGR